MCVYPKLSPIFVFKSINILGCLAGDSTTIPQFTAMSIVSLVMPVCRLTVSPIITPRTINYDNILINQPL